ncbi:hypothetical protein Aargi30884_17510 [Amedibacterium intestinale]|uniref:HTH cro/C1-type domain-containing protein n=1 Tax=Amedibacterium intestinale TaxID=2583452 RepID=A0A6N4TJ27_9FIRM|nr:helix-turn-helix transcriptional regulator [Amedibacterium intestinale]BBK22848.1 hypothetical protein Aargi30884_17510 [Amedibacterium intestinale]
MENNIGTIVRKIRNDKKISAKQLAYLSNYSSSYICDIEKKRKVGTIETYINLFEALGFDYKRFIADNEKILGNVNDIVKKILFMELSSLENKIRNIELIQLIYKHTLYDDEIVILKMILKYINGIKVNDEELKEAFYLLNSIENVNLVSLFQLYYFDYINESNLYPIELENKLLMMTKKAISKSIQGMIYYKLAEILEKKKIYSAALEYSNLSKKIFVEEINMNRLYVTELHTGNIYVRINDIDKAVKIFLKLINDRKVQIIKPIYSSAINNLIWTYFIYEEYIKTIEYINKYRSMVVINNQYFMLLWSYLQLEETEKCYKVIQEIVKCKIIVSERLDILVNIIQNIKDENLELKINNYFNNLIEKDDVHSKVIGLRIIVFYYESLHKYKNALKYSKILNSF